MPDKTYIYRAASVDQGEGIIEGHFSTMELAEAAMRRLPNDNWYDVETIELDSLERFDVEPEVPMRNIFRVVVSIIYNDIIQKSESQVRTDRAFDDGCIVTLHVDRPGFRDYVEAESVVSMDHAVEVAQAARLKFIRENEGRLSYDPDWHLKNRFAEE
jgi:hypothetical protein